MSRLSERLGQLTETAEGKEPPAVTETTVGVQPRVVPVEEAQARYDTARADWLDALRASRQGSNRELARLAVAQKEYEDTGAALERANVDAELERQRLEALRARRDQFQRTVDAISNQAADWGRVHDTPKARSSLLGRIFGRR